MSKIRRREILDWESVDWKLPDKSIAEHLGCARATVRLKRKILGKEDFFKDAKKNPIPFKIMSPDGQVFEVTSTAEFTRSHPEIFGKDLGNILNANMGISCIKTGRVRTWKGWKLVSEASVIVPDRYIKIEGELIVIDDKSVRIDAVITKLKEFGFL